jgi:hypothetical protein
MRLSAIVLFAAWNLSGMSTAFAADFAYSVDAQVYYTAEPPSDGRYLRENFLVTAKPEGFTPKRLNIYVDFSTGPGEPIIQTVSCGVGEIQSGWTIGYRGVSCNWPDAVTAPAGKKLYVSLSTAFAPFDSKDEPSTFPVVVEAVRKFPGNTPTVCQPPPAATASPAKGDHVSLDVYRLPGAIAPDGTLDPEKICAVATPHAQGVAGLRLWGTLVARKGGRDVHVGSFICQVTVAPEVFPAGKAFSCPVKDNNNAPLKMIVPAGAKLYVASTVTLGRAQGARTPPRPLQFYGAHGDPGK